MRCTSPVHANITLPVLAASFAGLFLYFVVWATNFSNSRVIGTLKREETDIAEAILRHKYLLRRIAYRAGKAVNQLEDLQPALGKHFDASFAPLFTKNSFNEHLQRAGTALRNADMREAIDALTDVGHHLLNQLILVEDQGSTNSSLYQRLQAQIKVETARQRKLQACIAEKDHMINHTVQAHRKHHPEVSYCADAIGTFG